MKRMTPEQKEEQVLETTCSEKTPHTETSQGTKCFSCIFFVFPETNVSGSEGSLPSHLPLCHSFCLCVSITCV